MKLSLWRAAASIFILLPASADPISSEGQRWAMDRLIANPKDHDRVDHYCKGKELDALCSIAGSLFAGGGAGVCRNEIHYEPRTDITSIDLTCVRDGKVVIDRQLPFGGFVKDREECERDQPKACEFAIQSRLRDCGSQFTCNPLEPTPSDRFCGGKSAGEACTAELSYQGNTQRHQGVCKEIVEERNYYFRGHRTAKRKVVRCEPQVAVQERTYSPAKPGK